MNSVLRSFSSNIFAPASLPRCLTNTPLRRMFSFSSLPRNNSGEFGTRIFFTHKFEDNSVLESRIDLSPPKTISVADLPPPIHPTSSPSKMLSESEKIEILQLRNQDPVHWTRNRLAKKFGCSPLYIGIIAKCPEWRIRQIQLENEQKWLRMGYKKRMIKINRIKRRFSW
ncbi:hypothetical protein BB559_004427 [Furculomyces boomerangus]|uniref:Uncharacterized protein n=1 Tax=Furculomyces boomerangus TaxID=61424 RepID=A0A2T9YEP1_9FUNG|nr:hypothetical protein BB559_004427 [Furculomyces boomerangus]